MMRGLTLFRPWDWAMAHGGKDIENRKWKPPASVIGQRIALHAGKTYDYDGADFIKGVLGIREIPLSRESVIVATTLVRGWLCVGTKDNRAAESDVVASSRELIDLHASGWFFGPYGWAVVETIALPKPVPCKGAQGLWRLPPKIEAEVLSQEQQALRARSKSA